ncbi:hypothetical protein [Ammoniphilus sp. CFH 90114]|uniref:hypothetical protein n=1 Tax=Ammoniphilus sp. CFH 90114 TaxID=2493665 RepID=UPI00100ECEED|nr:hypothetical protein [Ammoniphilus sp. CFH 90114]RXT06248.1 hypothetical protein EIZ39_14260 [Ammoniphilus sp. CFH 90114]
MGSNMKMLFIFLAVAFQLSAVLFIWINLTVTYWLLAGYAISLISLIILLVRERRQEKKEEDNNDYSDY